MLTFNDETHTYTRDGKVLPSVTQIINHCVKQHAADDWYLQRGKAVHKATELHDRGRLDPSTVDPRILPRVNAWIKFRRDYPRPILAIETMIAHPTIHYAGTIDRVFDGPVVLDLKSSYSAASLMQVAAYSAAWEAVTNQPVREACVVELRDDGSYRAKWIKGAELRDATRAFFAAITLRQFTLSHNVETK